MERKEKICFLMSPIGEADSATRRHADDLYELIIIPALKVFDFKVIRADKIPHPSIITNDIIQFVQNAELCIIDLTGSNPNVFYECGRRHETGKPFIQLIRRGEQLPFDVSGIRTIEYDLSTPRSVHDAIETIQTFINELQTTDFPTTTGVSLSTIALSLERIERKIGEISTISSQSFKGESIDPFKKLQLQLDPVIGLEEALNTGNLELARTSLKLMEETGYKREDIFLWAVTFASYGDKVSKQIFDNVLKDEAFDITEVPSFEKYLHATYSTFQKFGEFEKGYNYLVPRLRNYIEKHPQLNLDIKFTCLEVLALCHSLVKDYETAVRYSDEAHIIKSDDIKILSDQLYYYKKLNRPKDKLKVAKKMIQISGGNFSSYLTYEDVINAYLDAGEIQESQKIISIYKNRFPFYYATYEKIKSVNNLKELQN